MKQVAVVGHFAFGKQFLDGQTVKTKILAEELERIYGKETVVKIDTHGNKLKMGLAVVKAVFAMFKCKNIVVLPAHNGVRVFIPLLSMLKKISKCRLHYSVIGGWLADYIKDKKRVQNGLKSFDGIYVETKAMKNALDVLEYKNVFIMPNCKNLNILKEDELVYNTEKPYKLCTFSRVMKEKGIEDAVKAVKAVNEKYGETIFTLDIYGQVDAEQTDWFENLKNSFPDYVKYGGLVPFDKSTEVLKNYFALLFPTYYAGEGFAGTVIDALAAGVPIVSSDWRYNSEVVNNGDTGKLFETGNSKEFTDILDEIFLNAAKWNELKLNCINKAEEYLPKNVIGMMTKKFN